jgi:GNAT superfamily N-acetyltransferase
MPPLIAANPEDGGRRRRRTLGHIWRRGREIVRDEGWRRLAFIVLADLGYRRFFLYERRLDEPIVPVAARLPLVFEPFQPAAFEEYLRVHAQVARPRLEERLARGDECYLARTDGRIAAVTWISRDAHFFRSIGCRYVLRAGEVYLYDSFTDPHLRGQAIAPGLGVWVLERLRQAGVTRAVLAIAPENAANRRARAKTGFRPFMRIDYVRIGTRRWHRHRATDAHGRTRAP